MEIPILLLDWQFEQSSSLAHLLGSQPAYRLQVLTPAIAKPDSMRQLAFDLLIVAADHFDETLLNLLQQARLLKPTVPLILLTSRLPVPPQVQRLGWQVVLPQPYPTSDLLALLAQWTGGAAVPAPAAEVSSSADVVVRVQRRSATWLQDLDRAAQYLTQLSLESSAQAALILRESRLWASAGHLPQLEIEELAEVTADFWRTQAGPHSQQAQSDVARFVRLPAAQHEYMVYATRLAPQLVLVLAFEAETPFSLIRAQAGKLARALASEPQAPRKPAPSSVPLPEVVAQPAPLEAPLPPPVALSVAAEPETAASWFEALVPALENPALPGKLQAPSSTLVNIVYACVLTPRMPQHYLKGDLSLRLAEWLPQLCLAFGWRLEQIAIRPEYLHWLVRVSPAASPGYLMRILRQQTSQRIFEAFPALSHDNPSGDFWAPGYLIMSSQQALPAEVIRDFIQQTRAHQGVSLSSLPQTGA